MSNGMKIEQGINDENQQIAYDSDCQIIFQLFAQLARYKDTTKKSDKEKLAEAFEKERKDIVEFEIAENYKFENGQLVNKTEYMFIDQNEFDEKFQLLIQKINIVNRELDKKFIDVLKEILIQYSQLVVNKEENSKSITQKIIQNIQNPENQDIFQYLLTWQRLRSITKQTRMEKALEKLEGKRKEYKNKKSQKVKRKLKNSIDYHEKELIEENSMNPIEYLITKLISAFNQIIENN